MAHAGKFYPLAFRRDLWLDAVTYRNSWPKYWRWNMGTFIGPIGSAISGKPIAPLIEVPNYSGLIKWVSPWKDVGGESVKLTCELVEVNNFGVRYRMSFILEHQTEGVLFDCSPANPFPGGASPLLVVGPEDIVQPSLIDVPLIGAFCNGRAIIWSELPEDP